MTSNSHNTPPEEQPQTPLKKQDEPPAQEATDALLDAAAEIPVASPSTEKEQVQKSDEVILQQKAATSSKPAESSQVKPESLPMTPSLNPGSLGIQSPATEQPFPVGSSSPESMHGANLSFLLEQTDKQEKDNLHVQGCIDSLTVFDEMKREQTYYKQIIKDSFSWVFSKKSKMCAAFTLEAQLPEMAMRVQLLPIEGKKEIVLDKAEMYIVLQGDVWVKPISPFIQIGGEDEGRQSNEDMS